MAILETLRPFFRLCQLSGFIPYRMEFVGETGGSNKTCRFSFSFKYPITWWYIFLCLAHLGGFFYLTIQTLGINTTVEENGNPLLLKAASDISIVTSHIVYFGTRFICLRYSLLSQILRLFQQVDYEMSKFVQSQLNISRKVVLRIIVASLGVVFWVRQQ